MIVNYFKKTILILFALALTQSLFATKYFVKPSGNNANDGMSWATAKANLSGGLAPATNGDTIFVAVGTYTGTFHVLEEKSGVSMFGGFVGFETKLSERPNMNYGVNEFGQSSVIIGVNGGYGGNDAAIYMNKIYSNLVTLDGFLVQARAVGATSNGAGVVCASNTKVSNCTVTLASKMGISMYRSGNTITNCTIENCLIMNNGIRTSSDGYDGGGIYIYNATATVKNCIINGNRGRDGGGVYVTNSSNATIVDCFIINNEGYYVGGICNTSPLNLINCFVLNNRAWSSSSSSQIITGGIWSSGTTKITGCVVANNTATNTHASGFSIAGGIFFTGTTVKDVVNTSIVNNLAETSYVTNVAGGIVCTNNTYLTDCLVWGNKKVTQFSQLYGTPGSANYSAIQGVSQTGPGNINLSADNTGSQSGVFYPFFANPSLIVGSSNNSTDSLQVMQANWRLIEGSACIDKGIPNTSGLTLPETDIYGNPRISGGRIDIGAAEYFDPNFISVTNITDVPTTATAFLPLTLSGTVVPSNATHSTISWSVQSAGTTGATISGGNILNTTNNGTVVVLATIANGTSPTQDFTKTFSIIVSKATLSGTVIVGGSAVFGQTLTANTTELSSLPEITNLGTLFYQWQRNTANISGATASTYTLVQADIGQVIRVVVSSANCTGTVTSLNTSVVTKAPQTAPPAPTMASNTATSITLVAVSGCEYNIDGGAYQSSNIFSGLSPSTSYTFTQYKPETLTHFASPPSSSAIFSTKSGTDEPQILGLEISPKTTVVMPNQTQQFTVTVFAIGGADESVTWSVLGNSSTLTTITANGLLSVGSNETTEPITVRVTSVFDPTKYDEAIVSTSVPTDPEIISVVISPKTVIVLPNQTQQFSVMVLATGGANESVSWSVAGQTSMLTSITASGLLTVGSNETAETITVKATSVFDPTKSDEATVTTKNNGIIETTLSNIKIYPNPTRGELRIVNYDLEIENVEIYDVYGRKLFHTSSISSETMLNVSYLQAGVYFLKISTEVGKVIRKVLKE